MEDRSAFAAWGLRSFVRRVYRRLVPLPEPEPPPVDPWFVTAADVGAAYRLLLGREPDPDGLHTFGAMIGTAHVANLAGALLSSEEFRGTMLHDAVSRREHEDLVSVDIGAGLRLLVSAHDLSNQSLLRDGVYEAHLTRALDEQLVPGMAVCAVGANVGYHVVRAAQRVGPAGRVFAFEAHPGNAQLVARNAALNQLQNVMVLPLAVSDRQALHRYVAAQGTNGYVEPLDAGGGDEIFAASTLLQSIRLDDLLALLPPIAVLQIDVEGCEGRVLRGAQQLVARDRPTIFSELCLGQLARNSAMTGEDYLGLLRTAGYQFAALGFDGTVVPFGDDVGRLCAYARAQPTALIDVRCTPR